MNILRTPELVEAGARSSVAATGRIGELEVLRTVAILMVLAAHVPFNLLFWPSQYTNPLYRCGTWSGVDLFFAVSGFVIARSLLPQLEGVRDIQKFLDISVVFWMRRAWRLWPSAWFWLAAPLVLSVLFNRSHVYGSLRANWCMAVAGVINLANFHVAYLDSHQITDKGTAFVQWSLSLEEQFYMVLPFAALLFRRYLALPLFALLVLAFFMPGTALAWMIRSGAVSAGVLLAIAARHPAYEDCAPVFLARHSAARIAVLVGGVTLMISIGATALNIVPFLQGPIAILSGLLVWVASYGQGFLWKPGLSRQIMEIIAARSYSLYLVHIPVFFGMHEMWFRLYTLAVPTHRQALIYFAATLVPLALITELNYRFLESPLREHGKILARRYAQRMQTLAA
ncbi:MAG TPA: acyltransferase [Acidocella sp.]|jgi:peptidoglycan/LPS O-acetylase OafA/YrhL|nr:acyltransferase [Acidocella sp.]